uniref:Neprilysin n=1 Tax=Hadrurus spadix TaxID=141984 RepID=A0A1W7RA31_9SCOR
MSSNMSPFTDVESNGSKAKSSAKQPEKEKCLIASVIILVIILIAFLIAVIVLAVKISKHHSSTDTCATAGCLSVALEILESMNTSVDPCEDFYEFACGKWIANFKGNEPSKFGIVGATALYELHDNIVAARSDPEMPQSVKNIAEAYIRCSLYGDLRDDDELWLLNTLQQVGGWPMTNKNWNENQYHWERNLAEALGTLFIGSPVGADVSVNLFDSKHHIFTIGQHSLESLRPFEKERILSLAKRIGDRTDASALESEYEEMQKFAEQIKKMSRPAMELLEDSNETKVLTIRELKKIIPWVNWMEFIEKILEPYLTTSLDESEPVLIFGISYVSKFFELIFKGTVKKRTLANYIGATFIQSIISINANIAPASVLSSKDTFRSVSKIREPVGYSEVCLDFISKKAGIAVDFITYKQRKTETVGDKTLNYFFRAMKDLIGKASWLDEKTESAALEKLEQMHYFSGFPERAKDREAVDRYLSGIPNVTENSMQNLFEIQRNAFRRGVELLRKPVDRKSWPTTEGTHASQLNAFYVPEINDIVIPADIQREPIFSPEKPKFWTFGAMGWVLGHEITHAFDTSGSKRDKTGNLKNWWMPKAKEEFERRSRCFIEQYNKFSFGYKDYHVNGTQTVGENVADNGGLHQAFLAYKLWEKDNGKEKHLPGLEKYDPYQLFFVAASQMYCSSKIKPEYFYQQYAEDEHSPMQFRFHGAAANSEDFANAFKCKPGTPMNPIKKCVIW